MAKQHWTKWRLTKMASCQNIAQVSPKIDEKLAVQATLIEAPTI
jgi:hypothetical protein